MPTHLNYLILIFAAVYAAVLAVQALSGGVSKRWASELALLLAALLVLHLTTGFPGAGGRQSFGAGADLGMVALMFVGILAGMAARYIFERRLGIEPQRCESLLQGEPATIATRSRSSEPGNRGRMKG